MVEIPRRFAFDLEGTLVDLEDLHQKAFEDVASKLGATFGKQEFHAFVGAGDNAISDAISRLLEGKIDGDTIRILKSAVYRDMLFSSRIEPRKGVLEYLDRARSVVTELLVVSLTPPENAGLILTKSGLSPFFYFAITNDRVAYKKPKPDAYLAAAHLFNLPPSKVLVHEDSPPGVKAAKLAGSPVAAFPVHENLEFDPEPNLIFMAWKNLDPLDVIEKLVEKVS